MSKEAEEKIRIRIQSMTDAFKGQLPERHTLVWNGYLVAAAEWEVITLEEFARLLALLPKLSDKEPVDLVVLGVVEEED